MKEFLQRRDGAMDKSTFIYSPHVGTHNSHSFVHNNIRYVVLLYWAITTMTTIGFGDITPQNTIETIYVMVGELVGVCAFAYGMGNVCGMIFNHNKYENDFEECNDNLYMLLARHNISGSLASRVQKFMWYKHHSSASDFEGLAAMEPVLQVLSPELRAEIRTAIIKNTLTPTLTSGVPSRAERLRKSLLKIPLNGSFNFITNSTYGQHPHQAEQERNEGSRPSNLSAEHNFTLACDLLLLNTLGGHFLKAVCAKMFSIVRARGEIIMHENGVMSDDDGARCSPAVVFLISGQAIIGNAKGTTKGKRWSNVMTGSQLRDDHDHDHGYNHDHGHDHGHGHDHDHDHDHGHGHGHDHDHDVGVILKPGSSFGEVSALLGGEASEASEASLQPKVYAMGFVDCFVVWGEDLLAVLEQTDPEAARGKWQKDWISYKNMLEQRKEAKQDYFEAGDKGLMHWHQQRAVRLSRCNQCTAPLEPPLENKRGNRIDELSAPKKEVELHEEEQHKKENTKVDDPNILSLLQAQVGSCFNFCTTFRILLCVFPLVRILERLETVGSITSRENLLSAREFKKNGHRVSSSTEVEINY